MKSKIYVKRKKKKIPYLLVCAQCSWKHTAITLVVSKPGH